MRRKALIAGLGCVSIALSSLCGCTYQKYFSPDIPTLPNDVAIDRALRLCSLTEGEMPFHLMLDITPPLHAAGTMRAQVEVFWMNPFTYRTVIHSPAFTQTRIVNGVVTEEHNTGDYYPRWIQNFVDALLNPVPQAAALRKVEGSVPVGPTAHACISQHYQPTAIKAELLPERSTLEARICFLDAGPKLASGEDFTRHVSFDDFAAFGSKQVARTLVNVLPANTLVKGRIVRLEPLEAKDYPLLKAREYSPAMKQIQTRLVPQSTAESLLLSPLGERWLGTADQTAVPSDSGEGRMTIYVRTDRTGRVREAYRDRSDIYGLQNEAVAAALNYRFKPLIIRGVAMQMEAPITIAVKTLPRP